jgi:hypothetical protein
VCFCSAAALALAIVGGNSAKADFITTNPDLPPINGGIDNLKPAYLAQFHALYPGVSITFAQHQVLALISRMPSGPNDIETVSSQLTGQVAVNGGAATPFTLNGPVQIEVFNYAPGDLGTFSTQMLSMDLTGTVAGHSVEIMLDGNLGNSTGQTSITSLGGGLYDIHSFFDIFTEISLDGGPFQGQIGGPSVVTLEGVPEPSTGILLLTAGLMVLPAYARWGRRRA